MEHYDLEMLTNPSEALEFIDRFNRRFDNRIVRTESPDFVLGTCGYNIWIQPSARAVLGYDLGQSHWRQGIMSQALHATLNFGFTRWH